MPRLTGIRRHMGGEATQSAAPVHRFILLTDIAQSSRLAERYGKSYLRALEEHNQLVEAAVARRGGEVYKQTGDGYLVLFETADACLDTALELGEALGQLESLAEEEPLLVRLALHAGSLQPSGREYFGPALNRVSRICQVCNPGQVLLSGVIAGYFGGAGGSARGQVAGTAARPTGYMLRDLGQHHLRDLAEPEQLYQLDSERFIRHEFPPLSTLDNRPNNLVEQPNTFIGRERELKELADLLMEGKRLVSIVAPGGYGKSRLAAQLCANLLHRFARGVFMAYLAPVRESLDVPTAIANALGYQFTAGRTLEQQLCDYLRAKELLLCLDNFEHLLESAPLVAALLQAAPQLKIVTTSREPLRLEGEYIYRLEPLSVQSGADGYSDAELLFADRAALVKQGYALTAENAAQVRHFCEHLSGIPLAIELAAAWMDGFTLAELHDELSSRLELETRTGNKPLRHQSLQACLDWSWKLLGENQQRNLMKLSTFRGGFFSDAASGVLGIKGMPLRSALLNLCDKSWLYAREVDGQTRFYLRDMLAHEYAFARLEETRSADGAGGAAREESAGTTARPTRDDSLFEQAVSAHAAYYAALVDREGPRLSGGWTPDGGAAQLAALRTWRLELDNILEALDSAVRREEVNWLLPVARYLQQYLHRIGDNFTQRERYNLLLEAAPVVNHAELRAQAQLGLGRAQWRLGSYDAARLLCEQALAISRELNDRHGEARCLNELGTVEQMQGNYSAARMLYEQVLTLCRELDDRHGEESCLNNLGIVEQKKGDFDAARALYEQALAISRELNDRHSEARCLINLGNVERLQGNSSAARMLYEQALAHFRELGNRNNEASCLLNLGIVETMQGNYREARALYERALVLFRELGDRDGETRCLGSFGTVETMQGNYSAARMLNEQALTLFRELGDRDGEASCLGMLGIVEHRQGNSSAARALYEQALALFRELGDRNGKALCLKNLGLVEQMQDNFSAARALYEQSLELFRELGNKSETAVTCAYAGASLAALDCPRAAALAIYGAQHCAAELGYRFDPPEQQVLDSGLAHLKAAVADGSITAEELLQWKAEAEALSLDDLAELALGELAKAKKLLKERGQATGTADGS